MPFAVKPRERKKTEAENREDSDRKTKQNDCSFVDENSFENIRAVNIDVVHVPF